MKGDRKSDIVFGSDLVDDQYVSEAAKKYKTI